MNVSKLWDQGITGTGVRVALIDDGLDYTSLDLKDNFVRLTSPGRARLQPVLMSLLTRVPL